MKNTSGHSNESSSLKGSLNKNLKKSSKSKSKSTKSNANSQNDGKQTTATGSNQGTNNAETSTTSVLHQQIESSKEKNHGKSYAGFGARTIEIIWEQHDTTVSEIKSEVYSKLAEDLTYRVWELINNIKIYSKHSGGKVTCDLVNEVLRDSDVPPVLGTSDAEWDRIECNDESYFYNADRIVLLRDEYLNEEENMRKLNFDLWSSWVMDRKYTKDLLKFITTLLNALLLGNENSFQFALEVGAFSPQIGCTLKIILRKCIEMLAFEQKPEIINRCLHFLRAISFNPHSRDVECTEQLFHLTEIIVCFLLGNYEEEITLKKDENFDIDKSFLDNCNQEIKKEVDNFNQVVNVDDIRNEYEVLLQMAAGDGFQERDTNDVSITEEIPEILENTKIEDIVIKEENLNPLTEQNIIKEENESKNDVKKEYNIESPVEMCDGSVETEDNFSPFKAEMINSEHLDLLCTVIGCLGSQFGYFQNECAYVIVKRMERFFKNSFNFQSEDYGFISRAVRGLISLGEMAFRELIPFMYKLDPRNCPDYLSNDFAPAAIFLNGREDIFLYEWLEELCGDRLQPFMLYYYKCHQKLLRKQYEKRQKSAYKMCFKLILKTFKTRNVKKHDMKELFPQYSPVDKGESNKIKINYGQERLGVAEIKMELEFPKEKNKRFNSQIVVGKRRLKSISTQKKIIRLSNYCYLQI